MTTIVNMRQKYWETCCWWGTVSVGLIGIVMFPELLVEYLYLLPSVVIAIACISVAERRLMAAGVILVAAIVGSVVSPKIQTNPPRPRGETNWDLIYSELWYGLPITIATLLGATVALVVSYFLARRERHAQMTTCDSPTEFLGDRNSTNCKNKDRT